MSKRYYGKARSTGACKVTVEDGNETYPLDPRHDEVNHSPDGFQWGYGGSGPAQLAYALCRSALDDKSEAEDVYMDFKDHVIARLDGDWSMSDDDIHQLLARIDEGLL